MGRYLSCGIATKLLITARNDNFKLKEEKGMILKEIDKYVDVSTYNIEECENSYILNIKKEFFDNNIHEIIKEVYSLFNQCMDYFKINKKLIYSSNFNQEEYPLQLQQFDENDDYDDNKIGLNYLNVDNCNVVEKAPTPHANWLIFPNRKLNNNLKIKIYYIQLWMSYDKTVDIKYEINLLEMINRMKVKYHSKIAKDLIYVIDG